MEQSGKSNSFRRDSGVRRQLEDDLRRLIVSSDADYRVPIATEMQLAADYRLGRNTVRRVLQLLTDEGLIRRKTGFGTFIVPPEERPSDPSRRRRILLVTPVTVNNADGRLDSYSKSLVSGITDYGFLRNAEVVLMDNSQLSAARLTERFLNLKFDGIIHDRPAEGDHGILLELAAAGIPQVTVSRSVESLPAIYTDHAAGMRSMVDFLYGIGHRRILFADLAGGSVFAERQSRFIIEMRNRGVTDAANLVWTWARGCETDALFDRMIQESIGITALIFSGGLHREIKQGIRRHALRIPEMFSAIALGENDPSLALDDFSIMREPTREIGFRAAELIAESKRSPIPSHSRFSIPGELVMRGSCRSPEAKQLELT